VYRIVAALSADLVTLAHEWTKAYSNAFELVHRREADGPNAIWQADHTPLDILLIRPDERAMLRERTKVGLDAAREEGRIGGRRPKLSVQQQSEVRKMITKGDKTAADAARLFKVHPATVSRLLARPSSRRVSRAK